MTLARCPLHWAHDLPDAELLERLAATGMRPSVLADLVRDRHTAGGEHRIEAELGPLPELVEAGLVPAAATDPALCACGQEADEPPPPAEPAPSVLDLMAALEASLAAAKAAKAPPPEPPPHQLADQLEYDELGWAQAAVDAAEAQAVADAAELGW